MNMHYAVGERIPPTWTDSEIDLLRKLWISKVVTKEIVNQLGRTPGAVSAKAHRLGLPRRRVGDKRVNLCITLSPSLADVLRQSSHKLGIPKAEYIRVAIARYSETVAE